MTDPRHNELLSAYLDGETDAAERAEVERLLAADPAARRLLDELRALSAAVQSLPRQELGEDISRRVLRVAERRMLAGEESDQGEVSELSSSSPDLQPRPLFRRFVNRRSLVWLSLTAGIAVMIYVNERQNRVHPPAENGREVALAPAIIAEKADQEFSPPVLRAAPTMEMEVAESAKEPAAVGNRGGYFASKKELPEEMKLPEGSGKRLAEGVAQTPSAAPPSAATSLAESKSVPRASGLEYGLSNRKDASARGESNQIGKEPLGKEQLGAKPADSAVGANLLVVRCDIKSETAKTQSFDKVLAANGIAVQEGPAAQENAVSQDARDQKKGLAVRQAPGMARETVEIKSQTQSIANRLKPSAMPDDVAQRRSGGKAKQSVAAQSRSGAATDMVDYIYVEALPAQIAATLAALSARPDVFLSVSVEPKHDETTLNEIVPDAIQQQMRGNQMHGIRDEDDSPVDRAGMGGMSPSPAKPSRSVVGEEESQAGLSPQKTMTMRSSAGDSSRQPPDTSAERQQVRFQDRALSRPTDSSSSRQYNPLRQSPQSAPTYEALQSAASRQAEGSFRSAPAQQTPQSSERQRVLFMLHVVDGDSAAEVQAGQSRVQSTTESATPAAPSKP